MSTSPVVAEVQVIKPLLAREGTWCAVTAVPVSISEPVFAGHYPGFPIFPGICVVECVHRSARLTAPEGAEDLVLEAMESARFVGPVFSGEVLGVELEWRRDESLWRCSAQATTERGDAAMVRLRYRTRSNG